MNQDHFVVGADVVGGVAILGGVAPKAPPRRRTLEPRDTPSRPQLTNCILWGISPRSVSISGDVAIQASVAP